MENGTFLMEDWAKQIDTILQLVVMRFYRQLGACLLKKQKNMLKQSSRSIV